MKNQNQQSPLEDWKSFIQAALNHNQSYQEIATHITARGTKTSRHSIRRAVGRWNLRKPEGFERPGFRLEGDDAEIVSKPSAILNTPEDLLRERGLDPEEWEIVSLIVNEWDAMTGSDRDNEIVTMKQLKVTCKRIKPVNWVYPARIPGDYRRPVKLVVQHAEKPVRRVVFVGDQQAPYHDPKLHDLFCEWLQHNQPDEGVLIGDTVDFPDISRHPENPEWHVSAQECIDAGYLLLRDYVQSSEATDWTKLLGNHDERIRTRLLGHQTKLYGLRRAQVPGKPEEQSVFHVSNLLRLDELGIKVADPGGNYDQGQVKLSKWLAARHGWIARKGSGASALATLEHLGYSIVVGHTHRQSIVHKTMHTIDGKPMTHAAVETGCMCKIEDGLGYAVAPDWQNGFATGTIWPDGMFKLELATYVDGVLYYRDQRYR